MNYTEYHYNPITKVHQYADEKGFYHRIDGPAYISDNVSLWFYHGFKHREDGPAFIIHSQHEEREEFWFHGKRIDSLRELQKLVRLKAFM